MRRNRIDDIGLLSISGTTLTYAKLAENPSVSCKPKTGK